MKWLNSYRTNYLNVYDENFNCKECSELEECYYKASVKSAHEFAESIDYGGYDSEEEFWENLD